MIMDFTWIYIFLLSFIWTYCASDENIAGVLWVIFLSSLLYIEKYLSLF